MPHGFVAEQLLMFFFALRIMRTSRILDEQIHLGNSRGNVSNFSASTHGDDCSHIAVTLFFVLNTYATMCTYGQAQ